MGDDDEEEAEYEFSGGLAEWFSLQGCSKWWDGCPG